MKKTMSALLSAALLLSLSACGGSAPENDWSQENLPVYGTTESTPAAPVLTEATTTAATTTSFTPIPGNVLSLPISRNRFAAGYLHSAYIAESGALYMWGWNGFAQLGIANYTDVNSTPLKVMDDVVFVAPGGNTTLIITSDGSLYYCGLYREDSAVLTPVKIADNVAYASAGMEHFAYITQDGSLYTWEKSLHDIEIAETPTKIMSGVRQVSMGQFHSAAVTDDGSLYTWGMNGYGQLGNGTIDATSLACDPVPHKIMDGVKQVACGNTNTVALKEDGSVYIWGDNQHGALCDGTTVNSGTPVKVMDGAASVACDGGAAAAVKTDGSLYVWGYNYFGISGDGQFGADGAGNGLMLMSPVKVTDHIAEVSLGGCYAMASAADGRICTWGENYDGQLGDGTTKAHYTPQFITLPE